MIRRTIGVLLAVFGTAAMGGCQVPPPGSGTGRAMTYNLEWLSEDATAERIANYKKVIGGVNPHVVAVQEVQSKKALEQVFPSAEWNLAILDDAKEYQEVGLAVKRPYVIEEYDTVFKDAMLDEAFPGGRDVLRVVVKGPNGARISFYVLHMKSRRGGRAATDFQREMAAGLLASYLRSRKDERQVVLGDFNDCPDDISVNILETGDLMASGGRPSGVKSKLLVNLMETLYDQDHATQGVDEIFDGRNNPGSKVTGAKEENEKWRGKEYDFRTEAKVHASMLDQILVSPSLATGVTAQIYSSLDCFKGTRGRVSVKDDGTVEYTEKGTRASDHLPVYVDLKW